MRRPRLRQLAYCHRNTPQRPNSLYLVCPRLSNLPMATMRPRLSPPNSTPLQVIYRRSLMPGLREQRIRPSPPPRAHTCFEGRTVLRILSPRPCRETASLSHIGLAQRVFAGAHQHGRALSRGPSATSIPSKWASNPSMALAYSSPTSHCSQRASTAEMRSIELRIGLGRRRTSRSVRGAGSLAIRHLCAHRAISLDEKRTSARRFRENLPSGR